MTIATATPATKAANSASSAARPTYYHPMAPEQPSGEEFLVKNGWRLDIVFNCDLGELVDGHHVMLQTEPKLFVL